MTAPAPHATKIVTIPVLVPGPENPAGAADGHWVEIMAEVEITVPVEREWARRVGLEGQVETID